MNSIFSLLFLAVQQRLSAINENKKTIRYIDHDLGQLSQERPTLAYPAVLIDMSEFEFKTLGQNVQSGEGILKLRLALAPYSATSNLTPAEYREKGLRFYEMEHSIHRAMQQWQPSYIVDGDEVILPNYFGSFNRVSVHTDTSRSDLRIRELNYRIAFEDHGTKMATIMAPATFAIDTDLLINTDELPQ